MKQIWRKSVRTRIEQQERWFVDNKGLDFAVTFIENIHKAASSVMSMPSIGQLGHITNGYTYRSILTHPKCRLYYRYNDDEVVFYKVHFSLMKPLP